MSVRRFGPADARAMPWANGRGVTRELARRETADGMLLCRLSVADVVEPGPFSALPGVDRHLTLIDGTGFTLRIGDRTVAVAPFEPVAFSGDDAVEVTEVNGPSRDFNVMAHRTAARTTVRVHRGGFTETLAGLTFFYVAAGRFTLRPLDEAPLLPGDLLEIDGEDSRSVEADGDGALIAVRVFPLR